MMPRLLALAVFIALQLFASVASCQTGDVTRIEKPDIKIGDQWMFRKIDLWTKDEISRSRFEVTHVNEDDIRLVRTKLNPRNPDDEGRPVKLRANRATWTFKQGAIVEGQYIALLFPLEIGKTWSYNYVFKQNSTDTTHLDCEAKVERWEEVVVPAGEFNSIKVAHSCTWRGAGIKDRWGGRSTETYWYAPNLRQSIKHEFQYSVLVPFGNGQPYEQLRDELVAYSVK